MKVINFFAGPGAGKSTTAAGLFFEMKCLGLKVELVTEYAKELAYEDRLGEDGTNNAFRMHAEQFARQCRLIGKVDFVITDSPLIKDIAYAHYTLKGVELDAFRSLAADNFDRFDNYNVWVDRVKPYAPYGRRESEESARSVDDKLTSMIGNRMHSRVDGDRAAPKRVLWNMIELGMVQK